MPYATTKDNVKLYYEEAGSGTPILFCHEFAGDHRNWELQMRYFSRRHRCITYSARGYKPSDVPKDWKDYSYKHWSSDAIAVLDHLKIDKAHFVGLSMGGYTRAADRRSTIPTARCRSFRPARAPAPSARTPRTSARTSKRDRRGIPQARARPRWSKAYGLSSARIPFLVKDPRGFEEFNRMFSEHDALGLRQHHARLPGRAAVDLRFRGPTSGRSRCRP